MFHVFQDEFLVESATANGTGTAWRQKMYINKKITQKTLIQALADIQEQLEF